MTLQTIIKKAKPVLRQHNIKQAFVFGSYARGEQKKNSDLDLLIDPPKGMSLFDLLDLEQNLRDKLGIDVDVVTRRSVNAFLKPYIKKDQIKIL
ncbi:nucleotidyltransferase domain-containing protein [Patescibacteria group bacterium]|nr:nucleotidyltransferase domain-containing protein [Patescibacteria group bacterium]